MFTSEVSDSQQIAYYTNRHSVWYLIQEAQTGIWVQKSHMDYCLAEKENWCFFEETALYRSNVLQQASKQWRPGREEERCLASQEGMDSISSSVIYCVPQIDLRLVPEACWASSGVRLLPFNQLCDPAQKDLDFLGPSLLFCKKQTTPTCCKNWSHWCNAWKTPSPVSWVRFRHYV